MSDKITLKKHGFESWDWDGESYWKFKFKTQPDGSVIAYDRETQQEVARYSSEEEADKPYWILESGKQWLAELRSCLEIEEGVTVGDFIAAIKKDELLSTFCHNMFGKDWDQIEDNGGGEKVVVSRWGLIDDGELNFHYDAFNCDMSSPLTEEGKMVILKSKEGIDTELLCEGEHRLSLLEILRALFDKQSRDEVFFISEENGEAVVRHRTGEVVDGEDLFGILLNPVEVVGDITLNHIFRRVAKDTLTKAIMAFYSWCPAIDAYHREAELPRSAADLDEDHYSGKLLRANIKRYMEIHTYRHKKLKSVDINDYFDFGCDGEVSDDTKERYEKYMDTPCPQEEAYGVSFSPAYYYSHLPLIVDDMLDIEKEAVRSRKGRVLEEAQTLATVKCPITLLELLDAVYMEISFNGDPEARDDFRQSMSDRVQEYTTCIEGEKPAQNYRKVGTFDEMLDYDYLEDKEWIVTMNTWLDGCPRPLTEIQRNKIISVVGSPYDGVILDNTLDTEPDDPPEEEPVVGNS